MKPGSKKTVIAYLKLIALLSAMWIFVVWSPRLIKNMRSANDLYLNAEEKNIDSSALFYTDEPITSNAEEEIKRALIAD